MEWVVEASELTKIYGSLKAVDSLSFNIKAGEIFGLLGPNGAGKTTTVLMMLGLTEPTSGYVKIYGYNSTLEPMKVKRITGYLPENVGFYEELTAKENLLYLTRLNGIPDREALPRIERFLEEVGLKDMMDREVGTFSKGMKQRLGIAGVLVKDPKLIILDEPTTGIDPEGVEHILNLIVRMSKEEGITVMLSSHLLYQVQRICDRVGILFHGRMVAQGRIEEIGKKLFGGKTGVMKVQMEKFDPGFVSTLQGIDGITEVNTMGEVFVLRYEDEKKHNVIKTVVEKGLLPVEVRGREYSLEEIYMRYFQEG